MDSVSEKKGSDEMIKVVGINWMSRINKLVGLCKRSMLAVSQLSLVYLIISKIYLVGFESVNA